ncbi:MAG: HindIII family type II restriction endonuclease [Acidobacteriaceae bacterium]
MEESRISEHAIQKRRFWIDEIKKLSGNFGADTTRLQTEVSAEIASDGGSCLRDHLRLCGAIPEGYGHDSSEEKLYSKYTDILVSLAFQSIGIRSAVLTERADAADVECWSDDYDFVADAKAFRLSRTAKNAKDFKVQAMHGWKRGRVYAMVVCPLYQLPSRASQIYMQAIQRDVCLFSFSHLSLLTALADADSGKAARELLERVFKLVATLHPSKEATVYWQAMNRVILDFSPTIKDLWRDEKFAASEALSHAKEEGLVFLAQERAKILSMSHDQALRALLDVHKLESRERVISRLTDNGLMGVL